MRKLIILILIMFFTITCVTFNLIKKLDPEIGEWFDIHEILMGGKVPDWIEEGNYIERDYFLRLPKEYQQKYVEIFWQLRMEGADEIFYDRLEAAEAMFGKEGKDGWRTDRGQILIRCGMPDFTEYYKNGQMMLRSEGMVDSTYIMVWTYWKPNQRYAIFTFEFRPPNSWRQAITGIVDTGNQQAVIRNSLKMFYPVEENWNKWLNIIY